MSNNIKIKRGLKAGLPNLEVGEFGLATDTNEVFIGTTSGNELVNGGGGGGGTTINIDLDGDNIEVMYNYVGDDPLNFTADFSNFTLGGGLSLDMGAGPMPISVLAQGFFGKTTLNYFEIIILFKMIIGYTIMGLIKTSSNDSIKDILDLYADDYWAILPNVFEGVNDVNINGAAFTVDFMIKTPEDYALESFFDLTGRGSDTSVVVETTSEVIDGELTVNGMTLKLVPNIKMKPNYDIDMLGDIESALDAILGV